MQLATTVADTPCAKRERPFTTEQEITKKFASMSNAKQFVRNQDAPPRAALMSPQEDNIGMPAADMHIQTPPHDTCTEDSTILTAYQSMRVAQQEVYAGLGLADNDASTLSQVTTWTLHIADKYRLKRESVYGGLYLYYTYTAHVERHAGMDDPFAVYKKRMVMNMHKQDKFERVLYEISTEFRQNMSRRTNSLLIATTCLCLASKMEEPFFDKMLRPSRVIADMCKEGHHLGRNKVYDFITVERDVVTQLTWRLFRVEIPATFLYMLFHEFAVSCFDQLETHDLVRKCLMSRVFVLMLPCDLAVVCLVSALRKTCESVPHASKLAQLGGMTVDVLLEHSSCVLGLERRDESRICNTGQGSVGSSSSSSSLNSSSSSSSVSSDSFRRSSGLYALPASELGDGAVDEVETL
jgi:hypothetical protein